MEWEDRRKWDKLVPLTQATDEEIKSASDVLNDVVRGTITYDKFFIQACHWGASLLAKERK